MIALEKSWGLAALFLIAACATPDEMRTRTPDAEASSASPAKEVATCIVDRWENLGPWIGTPGVSIRETRSGYAVAWRNMMTGHTGMLADVGDLPTGSRTRYFVNKAPGLGAFLDAVKACQQQ